MTTSFEQTEKRPTFSHADADVVEEAVQPHRRCDRPLVLALWWSRQPAAPCSSDWAMPRNADADCTAARIVRLRGTTNKTVRLRDPDTCEIAPTSPCSKHQSWDGDGGTCQSDAQNPSLDAAGTGSHRWNKGRGGCAMSMIARLLSAARLLRSMASQTTWRRHRNRTGTQLGD